MLLDVGAEIDIVDVVEGTPLQLAVEHGHEAVVALLLRYGADVNIQAGFYANALQDSVRQEKMTSSSSL